MNMLRRVVRALFPADRVARLVRLFAFLLVVMAIVMASEEPKLAYYLFGVEKKFRVLEYLGVGMGGVLLAIGAVIANRRAVAMEKAANAQAAANQGAEDGRRQERLKNAIEHLGHESDSVRLGGAYELFHLAQNTEDMRQTALDILCAHIRRTTGEDGYQEKHKSEPSTEIQSLLTLLFVQEHEIFRGCRIDLQGSWLNGADLTRARLQEVSLSGAQLRGVNLFQAQLQNASLLRVQLQEADLEETQLQEANLYDAQLQGANLFGAQLQEANLYEVQLQGTSLDGAQLQGANLADAQLQGSILDGVQLQGAILSGAQLQGASLDEAQLQGAILSRTKLQGVTCQFIICPSFKNCIHVRIGRESDLSGSFLQNGLDQKILDSLTANLSEKKTKELRETLEPHIGKPASNELPEDSGAITGTYTKEEAERWIKEYEEAMRGVPIKADG